jgi:hypothetical protein
VQEADAERLDRRAPEPCLRLVRVVVRSVLVVRVQVAVLDLAVAVRVGVEPAAPPAQQEPRREEHDHEPDERLGRPLRGVRQVRVEQHDRQPEQGEGDRVPEPPREPEPPGAAHAAVGLGRDQRGDRGEVIGVGRVAQPEQQRDHEHQAEGLPVRQLGDPRVKAEHQSRGRSLNSDRTKP